MAAFSLWEVSWPYSEMVSPILWLSAFLVEGEEKIENLRFETCGSTYDDMLTDSSCARCIMND